MPYLGSVKLAGVLAALRNRSTAVGRVPPICCLLAQRGAGYVREVLRIVARFADGLAYAHENGILHRGAPEEGAEDGLHDVVGVQARRQHGRDMSGRQRAQSPGVAQV